ncbi:MAG: flagellar biosynthesis protein FlgA, partial [Acidiferrobacterales bacterium]
MTTHFLVHDKGDTVGVVVVETVQAGQDLTGWVMETDET